MALVTWTHKPGDKYLIVGRDRNGKRFRKETENYHYAAAHNVWQGRLYHVRDGKRTLLKTWSN